MHRGCALNIPITLGYALQCCCLTQEHLAAGAELVEKVTEALVPDRVLSETITQTHRTVLVSEMGRPEVPIEPIHSGLLHYKGDSFTQ